MKIKSFGCSFIYGSELSDTQESWSLLWPSKKTWPALLASYYNIEYKSFACPGVGNLRIAEQVLTECIDSDPAQFIINWTYIDRYDYVDSASWNTILPNNNDKKSKLYYQIFHSEYRDKLATLTMMKLCIDTMLQHNIKFVMTYADDLIFDTRWHVTPAVTLLQNYIKPFCVTFDNKNFVQYANNLGHEITANGHLLESGHQACFEYAKTHFFKDNV